MKFSTAALTTVAPVAMARRGANVFPPVAGIFSRNVIKSEAGDHGVSPAKGVNRKAVSANPGDVIVIWVNPGGIGADTTTVNDKITVTATVTAPAGGQASNALQGNALQGGASTSALAAGTTHTVTVGGDALKFTPEQLQNVATGDMILFKFLSKNHTVTQSTFAKPCVAKPGGSDSGFQPNPNNTKSPPPQQMWQVNTTDPQWFYCKQKTPKSHCGEGMVFSVNPTADKTHAMFQAMAVAQNGTGSATPITGGQQGVAPPRGGNATAGAGRGPGATPGQGTVNGDGSCQCIASCSAGAFPAPAVQGVGAFGGMPGALPINMGTRK
ncbi:Cupredoxin [Metarhizium album ARSEF 1941]|uniref:Cupredoxin n=1 Tax=Metarhizium album (strain ARSEF 1941) TaxID=1081103 RepID=A0A0B2WUM1_METAS|nr:Cupredoxin [Metarhizium album ARSEF 1941]KHN97758.1 Cupredoxin [Metarhizium album ARSEF 1941]